jgi:hypothetical protein
MLEGYRDSAPADDSFKARILWRHLQLAVFLLRREPQPGRSWAERPLSMIFEIMRFSLEPASHYWLKFIQ